MKTWTLFDWATLQMTGMGIHSSKGGRVGGGDFMLSPPWLDVCAVRPVGTESGKSCVIRRAKTNTGHANYEFRAAVTCHLFTR